MKKILLSILAVAGLSIAAQAAATGTLENPLSVSDLISQGTPAEAVTGTYVKGYIVGFIPDKTWSEGIFGAENASNTNLILADSSSEDDLTYCIPVQLPSGNIRTALNLKEHPQNLGHEVILCGTHTKYFGQNGLKELTSYQWVGTPPEGGSTGGDTPTPSDALWSGLLEDASTCDWTFDNVSMGEGLDYVWSWKEYSGKHYLNASSYKDGASLEALAYAVSPVIDLSSATKPVLTFDHAAKFQTNLTADCKFCVRLDGATDWTEVKIPTWPTAGAWTFVSSGDIDLSAYAGKKIQIAFKYVGTTSAADTWEIKNVKIYGDGSGTQVPSVETGSESAPLSVEKFLSLGVQTTAVPNTWVKGVIVGSCTDKTIDSAQFAATDSSSQTNLLIAQSADVTDASKCIPVQLPAGDIRTALNLRDNPGNLGRTVVLCGSNEKYFGQAGLKSVTKYIFDGSVVPPTPPADAIYSALGEDETEIDWTFDNEVMPDGATYIWSWKEYNSKHYLNASSYVGGQNLAAVAFAVSPAFEIAAEATEVKATFDHAAKFQTTLRDLCKFVVREDGAETWAELVIPTWPEAGSWTFANAGEISLQQYAGKKIQLGFKYEGTTEGADTWEIKNLKVTGKTSTGGISAVIADGQVYVEGNNIVAPAGARAFNLSGVETGLNDLEAGFYIVVVDGASRKVVVK